MGYRNHGTLVSFQGSRFPYGSMAGRVVGTGRNPASEERAKEAGADAFISLNQSEEKLAEALRLEEHGRRIVIVSFVERVVQFP